MFISTRPEQFDLKPYVGKIVLAIGTGNAWKRGKSLKENVAQFRLIKVGPKSITVAKIFDDGSESPHQEKATLCPNGSFNYKFNGGLMLFKDQSHVDEYVQAFSVSKPSLESALAGISAEKLNQLYNYAKEIGAIR